MSHLVILPLLIPLVAAAALLLAGRAGRGVERAIGIAATAALLPVAILLIGIAAKNGILLVEFADQLRDQGKAALDAAFEAAVARLRRVRRGQRLLPSRRHIG